MLQLLTEGWEWWELPWEADIAWPLLADLAQRALNSSHAVSSRSSELEVMVNISVLMNEDEEATLKAVCDMTRLNGPHCAPYIESVGELATQISGGSAPTLHFLIDSRRITEQLRTWGGILRRSREAQTCKCK